jgi:glycosyltransferase involved in cell wall biosynthesis
MTAPRVLCVIIAHNEAPNLGLVVADIRAQEPTPDLLVVDDGSTDRTSTLLPRLGVPWVRLPERMGVGCAMRTGLRYARRKGYDIVVRIDGDGQHRADHIATLIQALHRGGADLAIGSRYQTTRPHRRSQRLLRAILSLATCSPVTDPTSGFCAFGPRATCVLAEHHPNGYPEPELRLFAERNALAVAEVAVRPRARFHGRTSLTPARIVAATARVVLALATVRWQRRVREVIHA